MDIEILETLRTLGITVTIIPPDRLRLQPASRIPPELLPRIRQAKPEILAALARPTVAVQPAECRHCEGRGKCDCPACTLGRTEEPAPCLMCHPADRQLWLAANRPETCWHCGGSGMCGCIACNPKEPCRTCGGSGKASWIQ
jgi:hypothetical protein